MIAPSTAVPAERARASFVHLLLATALSCAIATLYVRVEGATWVLGWIAFVPWLAALDRVRSLRRALVAGLLMSEGFTLAVFYWFAWSIRDYTDGSGVVAWLVLLAIAPLLQPQFIFLALARTAARGGGAAVWLVALAGAGSYTGSEWLVPKLFSDTWGQGQHASVALRQAADLFGAAGLTFILIVANECVLVILRRRRRSAVPAAGVLAGIFLALLLYGEMRRRQFEVAAAVDDGVVVGMVQADLSHYGRMAAEMGTYDAVRLILDAHFALSAEALARAPLDLLVWPETVYPTTFGAPKSADGAAFDAEIVEFVAGSGVPLLFGAYDAEQGDEFNAAFLLEPVAPPRFTKYRKAILFPLTERVPALFESAVVRSWLPWLGTWKAGGGAQVFDLKRRDGGAVRLAPLICYDAVEPSPAIAGARQGAEMFVTISNDSWFAQGSGVPHLILVVSAFRSIETRRPQVRATNTGVSAFVSPTGEIADVIDVHEKGIRVRAVRPVRAAETLMLAWGDWFGPFALVLGGVALAFARVRRARSPAPPEDRGQPARKRTASRAGTPPK